MINNLWKHAIIAMVTLVIGFPLHGDSILDSVVGFHRLRVVNEGVRYNLVSLPFIKPAKLKGKLNKVSEELNQLVDHGGGFANLGIGENFFLLIRDGDAAGAWFSIHRQSHASNSSANPNLVEIDPDSSAGALSDLTGIETFSVHEMYTIEELFPPDADILPAHNTDFEAGQVHLYSNQEVSTFWLSNGEQTDGQVGWVDPASDRTEITTSTPLLPGICFGVYHPNPDRSIEISVMGEVPDVILYKPIYPGYNFVAKEYYVNSISVNGQTNFTLDNLQLKQSGFRSSDQKNISADVIFMWNQETGSYSSARWLFDSGSESMWMTTGNPSSPIPNQKVFPGEGFVVWNGGDQYIWGKSGL